MLLLKNVPVLCLNIEAKSSHEITKQKIVYDDALENCKFTCFQFLNELISGFHNGTSSCCIYLVQISVILTGFFFILMTYGTHCKLVSQLNDI